MTTYKELAQSSTILDVNQKKRYYKYMIIRWRDTQTQKCADGYAKEWLRRFEFKMEYEMSDAVGKALLKLIDEDNIDL